MFTQDTRTENFLNSLGVKFRYRTNIKLPGDLIPGWNAENIGRPVAVREDAVLEYSARMEAGSPAPAPILVETPQGFKVCDGVQRISAGELLQLRVCAAYVVQTDDENLLLTIRVMANPCMQGRAESADWTQRQAVHVLVVDRGMSYADVAKLGGWKAANIKKIAEAIELQAKITNVGGPELPDTMLAELRPHLQDPTRLAQAAVPIVGLLNTLKKSKISVADAVPYIEAFFAPTMKASNLHKTYAERLKDMHEDAEIKTRLTGRQATEISKDMVLLKALKSADSTLDTILTTGERVNNIDEFYRLTDRINKKLKQLAAAKKK